MKRKRLGRSGLVVTDICMGTMAFGLQADEKTSFAIMDRAVEAGIDFFDTAEMYPVPPSAETFGITEEIVGRWLQSVDREKLIIATKVTGPGHGWFRPPVREGFTYLDRRAIHKACEDSLRRLQTDYIDLYQTHWPDHGMRQEDTLEALTELVDQGRCAPLGAVMRHPGA
jgi:aryl-alcohol dehydrogenase-like predicted oxidoreductase